MDAPHQIVCIFGQAFKNYFTNINFNLIFDNRGCKIYLFVI